VAFFGHLCVEEESEGNVSDVNYSVKATEWQSVPANDHGELTFEVKVGVCKKKRM
jgi:hypothetical protein